jgi:hypothetical protein
MPIIKSGYRSDDDKRTLRAFYASQAWKQARAHVLERSGGRCEFCKERPAGRPLDVVHRGRTLELIRAGNALNVETLAAGHRACHSAYSSGRIPWPR